MKLITRLLAVVIVGFGLLVASQNASAQAIRTTVFSENHLPGGYGLRVDVDYDIINLPVSKTISLMPTIGLRLGYNVSIDDPRVRHLLIAGLNLGLRTVVSVADPKSGYSIDAVPWVGFSIDACFTIENTRADANGAIGTTFDDPGIEFALCYGPAAGLDVIIGKKLVLSFGIETLFFSLGQSGWSSIPVATFGLRAGIGYNAQF